MRVTDRDRAAYARDGFVVLDGSYDATTIDALRTALEDWAGRASAVGPYGILKNNVWREVPRIAQLIHEGVLASAACELMGTSEVALFQDNLVWKPPGGARIEWHQDFSYWPLDRPAGVTLWVAVDAAEVTNGCMHYIPGTHQLGERQPADFIAGTGQPQRPDLRPLDWREREADAVPVAVDAGRVVAHHPLVWHMSPRNASQRPRRALTFTWIAPTVRWDVNHAPHAYLYALHPEAGQPPTGSLFPRFAPVRTSDSS